VAPVSVADPLSFAGLPLRRGRPPPSPTPTVLTESFASLRARLEGGGKLPAPNGRRSARTNARSARPASFDEIRQDPERPGAAASSAISRRQCCSEARVRGAIDRAFRRSW
jgi:hypothetical protein